MLFVHLWGWQKLSVFHAWVSQTTSNRVHTCEALVAMGRTRQFFLGGRAVGILTKGLPKTIQVRFPRTTPGHQRFPASCKAGNKARLLLSVIRRGLVHHLRSFTPIMPGIIAVVGVLYS